MHQRSVGIACRLEWLESGPECASGPAISFLNSYLPSQACARAVPKSRTTHKKRDLFCFMFRSFVNVGHKVRKVNPGFGGIVSFAKGGSYLDTITLGIWQQ